MAALLLTAVATGLTSSFGITGLFASLIVGAATVAGAYLDRLLFTPSTTQQVVGPRLQATTFMGSSEGSPIYRGYGIFKTGGQIIWATRFEEEIVTEAETTGGKGGPTSTIETTTYNYYCSFAVGIAEGEIGTLYRIWADNKELLDLTKYTYRLYRGTETQNPDSLIETKEGDGNVPGYRGLAYIVFERMPLARFGNRVPQLTFELDRPVIRADEDGVESIITGVDLIPASGEFIYDPTIVTQRYTDSEGNVTSEKIENNHLSDGRSDWTNAMDQMAAALPDLVSVAFVVSWFGDDLRAGNCTCRPKVENATKQTHPISWQVSGLDRTTTIVLTEIDYGGGNVGPAYGGTPNDLSVYRAIQDLKNRGYKVMFYPFLMMDIPSDNVLPNPYSNNAATNGQPAFPWRGRITCSPAAGYTGTVDKTGTAATQVSAFVGTAAAGDFGGSAGTVTYSGPAEWSYRRFILHYAKLCAQAGMDANDSFLIGSEFVGLTTIRSAASTYPFVNALVTLASDVQGVLTSSKIGYAANWSEYHSHRPGDGSNDVYFNMDPLWSSSNIDFIGIDNYMPLSDWRDGLEHLDAVAGYKSVYDLDYLKANVEGGEYYDWYYASAADRTNQVRSPITDGGYGKPWVFRNKDIKSWWQEDHYNRPGGTESGSPTAWTPESKQIVFTEFGCPAIDKGTNQPNVFYDPKSSESFVPYFSSGNRDDVIQRQYIRATYEYWRDNANNPSSSEYSGRMLDTVGMHYWAFDARPWPSFPRDQLAWADKPNWKYGHWLNHRAGTIFVPDLLAALALEYGFEDFDFSRAYGSCDGYVLDGVMSFREAVEPLMSAFMFDLVESGLEVKATSRYELASVATVTIDDILDMNDDSAGEIITITRGQESELPAVIRMRYLDIDKNYNQASVSASRDEAVVGAEAEVVIDAPIVIDFARAQQLVDRWLFSTWAQREKAEFGLLPQFLKVEPGDVVTLDIYEFAQEIRVNTITDGVGRTIGGTTFDRAALTAGAAPDRTIPGDDDSIIGAPIVVFMDLPLLNDANSGYQPYIAAWSSPWAGVSVYRSATDSGYGLNTFVAAPAKMGLTTSTFNSTSYPYAWDDVNTLDVEIYSGTLSSITEEEVLNYANMAALVNSDGDWEIFCFANAELIGPNQYRLSHFIRGLRGTEHAMEDGLPIGSRIVFLNLAIQQVQTNLSDINQPFYYRYGPANKPYTDPFYVTQLLTFEGVGLKPLSPVQVDRDPSDLTTDVTITWIRRSRLGGDLGWDAADIPLGEEIEHYQVDILYSDDSVARTIDVYGPFTDELPNTVYTAAMQATDSIAVPFDVNVYQMSTTVGRGTPGRGTMADSNIIAIAAHGAKMTMFVKEEEITVASGATVDSVLEFPDRAIILGVSCRTTLAVTGATSYDCGIAGDTSKFGGSLGVSLGSTNMGVIGPTAVYANTKVRLTANGGNFSGGKVRVSLHYILNEASTS